MNHYLLIELIQLNLSKVVQFHNFVQVLNNNFPPTKCHPQFNDLQRVGSKSVVSPVVGGYWSHHSLSNFI